MNDNEEISLKELIQIIFNGWKLILVSVLVMLGISALIYFTSNAPTYVMQTDEIIIYTQDQNTELGLFRLPYSKVEDFLHIYESKEFSQYISEKTNVSIVELSKSIVYSVKGNNEYQVTISNNSIENTKKIHEALLKYSSDYINYVVSDDGINLIDISLNQKLTLLNKTVAEKTNVANYLENELNQTTMIISNNINPIYSSLSNQWIYTKKEIFEAEFQISEINSNIPKIEAYKSSVKSFNDYLDSNSKLEISKIVVKHNNILSTESYRFSAKTLFPISAILGFMLGVFIVFFKNYWLHSPKK